MTDEPQGLQDARWRKLVDAVAAEDPITDSDQDFLDNYHPEGPEAQAELELMKALQGLGEDEAGADVEAANSPLVTASVGQYLDEINESGERKEKPWLWVAAAAVLISAGAAIALLGERGDAAQNEEVVAARDDAASLAVPDSSAQPEASSVGDDAPKDTAPEVEPAPSAPAIRVESGSFRAVGGVAHEAGDLLAANTLEVGAERSCLTYDVASLCFEPDSKLTVSRDADTTIEVLAGNAKVEAPKVLATTLVLEVAGDHYTIEGPAVVVVTTTKHTKLHVEVVEGSAEVRKADGSLALLEPTERDPSPESTLDRFTDPKALLSEARRRRAANDAKGAIEAYRKFVEDYAEEPAAAPAMVTLGELYLARGRAKQALTWFGRYASAGGGTLDEEAAYGRIRALKALEREKDYDAAVDDFLARYPSSTYATKLR